MPHQHSQGDLVADIVAPTLATPNLIEKTAAEHGDILFTSPAAVVPGRGGMFSWDNGREVLLLTRSTVRAIPKTPRQPVSNYTDLWLVHRGHGLPVRSYIHCEGRPGEKAAPATACRFSVTVTLWRFNRALCFSNSPAQKEE